MFRRLTVITVLIVALAGTAALAKGRQGEAHAQQVQKLQQRYNLTENQMSSVRALDQIRQRDLESLRQDLRNKSVAKLDVQTKRKEINQRFMAGVKELLTPDQRRRK